MWRILIRTRLDLTSIAQPFLDRVQGRLWFALAMVSFQTSIALDILRIVDILRALITPDTLRTTPFGWVFLHVFKRFFNKQTGNMERLLAFGTVDETALKVSTSTAAGEFFCSLKNSS